MYKEERRTEQIEDANAWLFSLVLICVLQYFNRALKSGKEKIDKIIEGRIF